MRKTRNANILLEHCDIHTLHKEEFTETVHFRFGSVTVSDVCFSICCMHSKMI